MTKFSDECVHAGVLNKCVKQWEGHSARSVETGAGGGMECLVVRGENPNPALRTSVGFLQTTQSH